MAPKKRRGAERYNLLWRQKVQHDHFMAPKGTISQKLAPYSFLLINCSSQLTFEDFYLYFSRL